MKPAISILLVLVYLSLSVGFNVLLHTCGNYTSVYIMPTSTEDPCNQGRSHGCCVMDPCCKLELKIFHINDSQLYAQIPQQDNTILLNAIIPDTEYYGILRGHLSPIIPVNTSPPVNTPHHILYCSFLI